ncbi:MAG: sensor domain-containing diguanylate cyclase, partial [Clostridiales bacterium]|nr:sensor domain-containing diguanylate cyclase [Clostridiales bacterium]
FNDLAIYMTLLGVAVGVLFPFFVMAFGVPESTAMQPIFFGACIAAGILLAILNIALARKVVGARIKVLSKQMKHVEGFLSAHDHESSSMECTPENCAITVDSEDELGESAESFNSLIGTLSMVLGKQADLQLLSEMLSSHLELETLAYETLQRLMHTLHASGGVILTEKNGELFVATSFAIKDVQSITENALVKHTARTFERQLIQFPPDIVLDGVMTAYQPREMIIEPILYKQVLIGVIVLGSVASFDDSVLDRLTVYGPILALAFNNAITHQQMQQLAALDSLTGIYNRRFGYNRIQEEFSRSIRSGTALSLIMLDIDHFKMINDTYGHSIGDKMILLITKTMKTAIRDGDILIRYGGEEFLCILPGASQNDAALIAERIRIMVKDSILKSDEQEIKTTVSLGTATYPNKQINDIQQFISLADSAMYTAKNSGRNKVVSV